MHPESILPSKQSHPPVSVGELYSHEYQVSTETITEEVVSYLDEHPDIPGVILIQNGKLHSLIPRNKIFERLGHRFGVELFLRRPIIELQEIIEATLCMISNSTRIHAAASIALSRKIGSIYDPLVINHANGSYRILDVHVLLMAQSLIAENMHNIISNMKRIEHSIKVEIPMDASLDMILDAVKRTTPYHRAMVLIKPSQLKKISSHHELFFELSEPVYSHPLIKSIFDTRDATQIEDTSTAPSWKGLEFISKTGVWLGLPIASGKHSDGILSLSRTTNTPFSTNEVDMAKTFAEFLSIAINKTADDYEERQFAEMVQRKFI